MEWRLYQVVRSDVVFPVLEVWYKFAVISNVNIRGDLRWRNSHKAMNFVIVSKIKRSLVLNGYLSLTLKMKRDKMEQVCVIITVAWITSVIFVNTMQDITQFVKFRACAHWLRRIKICDLKVPVYNQTFTSIWSVSWHLIYSHWLANVPLQGKKYMWFLMTWP